MWATYCKIVSEVGKRKRQVAVNYYAFFWLGNEGYGAIFANSLKVKDFRSYYVRIFNSIADGWPCTGVLLCYCYLLHGYFYFLYFCTVLAPNTFYYFSFSYNVMLMDGVLI